MLEHVLGNPLVLQSSVFCQLTPTFFGIPHNGFHFGKHFPACRCQLVDVFSLQHHGIGDVVALGIVDVARPVASIVGYIERVLALGGWRELIETVGVGVVVAGRISRVLPDDVKNGL